MEVNNKCKECGSSLTYMRISTKERVCRSCGYIGKDIGLERVQNLLDEKNKEVIDQEQKDENI